tara:strand:- start:737 stop:1219 length:483 start_codon:yes stop_codon:yes gene_type:complete
MAGEFRQFKLTNHDEIIAEVIDHGDEDTPDIIVRKVMKIIVVDDFEENVRYYTFKPWLSFQDDIEELSSLNSVHVVGEATPSKTVMSHYVKSLNEVDRYNKLKRAGMDMNEIADIIKDMTEKEMEDFLEKKFGAANDDIFDSSDPKIIKFRPKNDKGTMH